MPCNCGGGSSTEQQQQSAPGQKFEVRLPNGETLTVDDEHTAKVRITMAGGGTYSKVS